VFERFTVKKIPLFAFPRRIADHSGCTSCEWKRTMTRKLKASQSQLTKEMSNMQRICRWIETYIDTYWACIEPR
jgi:Tfp pilus assembly protein PilV